MATIPGIPTNENDFMTMQQEAVRRVQEMQQRARRAVERSNRDGSYILPENRSAPHQLAQETQQPIIPEEPSSPPSLKKKVLRKHRHNKILPFDFPIRSLTKSMEFDDMLLIGLILLLMSEGTDEIIILALVYIFVADMDFLKRIL